MTDGRMSRRALIAAGVAGLSGPAWAGAPVSPPPLPPPISAEERVQRLTALRGQMERADVRALLLESGPSLEYFTGVSWRRSERTTAAVVPTNGQPVLVTPAFEEPSVRESLAVDAEVRPWNEDESPFERLAGALRDRGAGRGPVAVEGTTRSFIVDGVRRLMNDVVMTPGDPFVDACRMIKSDHEISLMQAANTITLMALKAARAAVDRGMTEADVGALVARATQSLGGAPLFSLVLINEASAYPHGSKSVQTVREGSVILLDCGCAVHGYQSDISRTFVFGAPAPDVAKVWRIVRRGQDVALEAARPGAPAGVVDDAVRRYYEAEGFGPGYRLPGLSHRTGHGIGLEGHEAPYLVRNETRRLAPGMCFSDEPGLYLPGRFGVRLEDCWRMTPSGPQLFTPLARSLDDPI